MNRSSKRSLAGVSLGLVASSLSLASLALAGPGDVSFTPTGLKLSVMQISLSATSDGGHPMSEQILYTCPHPTETECLVDVTNQAELDAIAAQAAAASVQVGTYDRVSLHLCAVGKNGMTPAPGFVKGMFDVPSEGKSYVTDPDPANVTGVREVTAGEDAGAEYAAIGNWSCSTKTVKLREPLVVVENAVTPVTVVMDAKLIAFSTPNVSPGMGGCRGVAHGHARGICVSYPSIFPLVGDVNPQLDRFTLSHHRSDPDLVDDAKANAYVVVARGADAGAPFTAFVRPFYSESSARPTQSTLVDPVFGGPGYFGETNVASFSVNADGSIAFETGGDLDDTAAIFHTFEPNEHKSVVYTRDHVKWQYHAIPVLP
jgi:hypothetical protein